MSSHLIPKLPDLTCDLQAINNQLQKMQVNRLFYPHEHTAETAAAFVLPDKHGFGDIG
jgi:hypothetical protein